MTRIVLCLSHSIEEYDQLRLLHSLGYEVASIGGYIDPAHPHDPKRPALPDVPCVPEVKAAVDALGTDDNLGNAQAHIPDAILDWLGADGVIIFHHHLWRLFGQWDRIRRWRDASSGRRVVWRTVGQSVEGNERDAAPFRADGLEVVRYSPKERNIPGYVGEDALIRFYKDPAEWGGWTGESPTVIQFVQSFPARWEWCNRPFFEQATDGLPRRVYGPDSEQLEYGGGQLDPAAQQAALRSAAVYLYTGTQPASYTLGLIEAGMTGTPIVSIGPAHMRIFQPYGPLLFEGHLLASGWSDDPAKVRSMLAAILTDDAWAATLAHQQRERFVAEFGREPVAAAWKAYLG